MSPFAMSAQCSVPFDVPRAEERHDVRHRREGARAREHVGEAPILGGRPALPLLADGAALVREVDAVRQLRHRVRIQRDERVALAHRHGLVQAPRASLRLGAVRRAIRRRLGQAHARGVVAERVRRAVQNRELARALHLDARVVHAHRLERRERVLHMPTGADASAASPSRVLSRSDGCVVPWTRDARRLAGDGRTRPRVRPARTRSSRGALRRVRVSRRRSRPSLGACSGAAPKRGPPPLRPSRRVGKTRLRIRRATPPRGWSPPGRARSSAPRPRARGTRAPPPPHRSAARCPPARSCGAPSAGTTRTAAFAGGVAVDQPGRPAGS